MTEIDDPRYRRLLAEQDALTGLAMSSPFISVEPVETQPGWPPDEYVITYTCRGIANIDADKNPIYSDIHRVAIKFSEHFPIQEPSLLWLTDIWHPNILHKEPRRVCTNAPRTWWAGKKMADIVRYMGEMVQYKRYHAKLVDPEPADREVAEWVREYAEPNNIIGPGLPVDPRPLVRADLYTDPPDDEDPLAAPPADEVAAAPAEPADIDFGDMVSIADAAFEVVQGPTFGHTEDD